MGKNTLLSVITEGKYTILKYRIQIETLT